MLTFFNDVDISVTPKFQPQKPFVQKMALFFQKTKINRPTTKRSLSHFTNDFNGNENEHVIKNDVLNSLML